MKIQRIDHAGINVKDLDAAIDFFRSLGFELQGRMDMEGEWVGKIIGLENVRDTIAMMKAPDGEAIIELVQFHSPKDESGDRTMSANTLGISHLCLAVDDVDAAVAAVQKHGGELMGAIHNYENVYKLCYVRGPEGIILELAAELGKQEKA